MGRLGSEHVKKNYNFNIHGWVWTLNRPYDENSSKNLDWYSVNKNGQNSTTRDRLNCWKGGPWPEPHPELFVFEAFRVLAGFNPGVQGSTLGFRVPRRGLGFNPGVHGWN